MTGTLQAQESIEGTLAQILFVNDDSGYMVARLERIDEENSRQPLSIVGNLAGIEIGVTLRLHGRFETHPRYGHQFRVDNFETLRPAGVAALERYLASEIKGVGPALARRIVEHFGEHLPAILDDEPHRLREVRGLGGIVVSRITAAWRDSSGLRELMLFLRGHGISGAHAKRIHKVYGARSLETIRRDPYLLARTVSGIGFRTADAVAEQLGIPRNSLERARAAVLYLLERMSEEGHVFGPLSYLENQFGSSLEMDRDLAPQAVLELSGTGEVAIDRGGDEPAVYLKRLYDAELNLVEGLRRLSTAPARGKAAVERGVAAAEKLATNQISQEQKRALRCALESSLAVITGGPGTGKTTLLRSLLVALDDAGIRPMLAAPTGRAARRLAEATGRDAKTLHRLLEYSPDSGEFLRGKMLPLRTSYLIVDEASMMDVELASSLLSALPAAATLVLVGDRDQLPSVGPGSVLKDVIASGLAPVIELQEVYRQAKTSMIVANAHRINHGKMPEVANDAQGDFFFLERSAPEDVLGTIKQLVQTRLVGNFGIRNSGDIQVITPMNRGPIGVHALNQELRQLLNPAAKALRAGDRDFREGDRVIQLHNNYEKQVFNGDIGKVARVDAERGRLEVVFEDNNYVSYDVSELDELALAYAISVHKSQGSQYPAVVMPLHPSHYLMLRRNLLYTAITRAERVCVLVGTRSALQQAVRNEEERRRFSRLADRLRIN
jgi:exodeoxyribonuclease V alpha subunit